MAKIPSDCGNVSEVEFKVNKCYADKYDSWRRKEEMQKFKDRYGKDALAVGEEEDNSSSSEDDDNDMEMTGVFDKEFYHTLSCLKAKDPKIYDKSTNFFENIGSFLTNEERKSKKKKKPLYLRDYERKLITEDDGIISDEDDPVNGNSKSDERVHSPSYFEEQEAIKESFKIPFGGCEAAKEKEAVPIGGMFSKKVKSQQDQVQEEDEYAVWLQGRKDELKNEEEAKGLSVLRSYWTDPTLEEGEAFLRDYILQKQFIENGKESNTKGGSSHVETADEGSDDASLEKEERDIENMEEFEHKFNFRFEEPDQEFIKRYPRTMDSTLRRKDDRRKQKREELRKRKDVEKQLRKEEICKAQELKRKEIEARLQQLCSVTGNSDIGFKGEDLEADFDPQEHDRRMNELFSQNSFYAAEEEKKPEFPSIDEELDIEHWDDWEVKERSEYGTKQHGSNISAPYDSELHSEDPNFNMNCEYDPKSEFQQEMVMASQGKRAKKERGRRQRGNHSRLAKALVQEKPLFNPSNFLYKAQIHEGGGSQSFEKYVDEYYGLDFEDVIGDLPCRFKYRKVMPNNFGLSIEEILNADDKELNRWCSLKKALRIRPEENEKYDLQAYCKKGANMKLKKKIFTTLYSDSAEGSSCRKNEVKEHKKKCKMSVNDSDTQHNKSGEIKSFGRDDGSERVEEEVSFKEDGDNISKKKNSRNSKKERSVRFSECDVREGDELVREKAEEGGKWVRGTDLKEKKHGKETNIVYKKEIRRKQQSAEDNYLSGITKSRLKAYGINPKKFKNKLKYKKSD